MALGMVQSWRRPLLQAQLQPCVQLRCTQGCPRLAAPAQAGWCLKASEMRGACTSLLPCTEHTSHAPLTLVQHRAVLLRSVLLLLLALLLRLALARALAACLRQQLCRGLLGQLVLGHLFRLSLPEARRLEGCHLQGPQGCAMLHHVLVRVLLG